MSLLTTRTVLTPEKDLLPLKEVLRSISCNARHIFSIIEGVEFPKGDVPKPYFLDSGVPKLYVFRDDNHRKLLIHSYRDGYKMPKKNEVLLDQLEVDPDGVARVSYTMEMFGGIRSGLKMHQSELSPNDSSVIRLLNGTRATLDEFLKLLERK